MTQNLGDVPLSELKHYGVKGMKWGVRRSDSELSKSSSKGGSSKKGLSAVKRASVNKSRAKASSKRRVAAGKGTFGDNVAALLTTSSAQIQKAGGYRNAQSSNASKLEAYADRIESGKGTVLDTLRAYGTTSAADLEKYS